MGAPFPPIRRSPLLRKAALVPLWILQLVVMFGMIGIQVYLSTTKGLPSLGGPETLIFMSLSAFCAILTLVEIALYAAHKLRPLPYLLLQLPKLAIWLTLLGLWVAATSTAHATSPTTYFIIQLIETVLPVLTFLAPTLYASITYHRHRHTPQHRHRIFSLGSGRYPEVSEKTLARNVWPASELHDGESGCSHVGSDDSPVLIRELDSPGSLHSQQELGNEGWVVEMEGEVHELAAGGTPRRGSRKGSRGGLSEALSPRGSGDGGVRGKTQTRVQRVDERMLW